MTGLGDTFAPEVLDPDRVRYVLAAVARLESPVIVRHLGWANAYQWDCLACPASGNCTPATFGSPPEHHCEGAP